MMASRFENNKTLVYYLGNKQRMASVIAAAIEANAVGDGPVADLFAGTGSASLAIAERRDVISVDIQEYARVICAALLEEQGSSVNDIDTVLDQMHKYYCELAEIYRPLILLEDEAWASIEDDGGSCIAEIIESGCLLSEYRNGLGEQLRGAMEKCAGSRLAHHVGYDVPVRHFGGTYFSYRQALQLSAACQASMQLPPHEKDVYLAATISAASHCGGTVGGQFAQPAKVVDTSGRVKKGALRRLRDKRRLDVFNLVRDALAVIKNTSTPRPGNKVERAECIDYLSRANRDTYSAIYADPPYSRYHYSRYYHVLETIALGDDPDITVNPATGKPSRGIYRAGRYQSPFSTRSGAQNEFTRLFEAAAIASPTLILSYSPYPESVRSTPRMVTIEQLCNLASEHFSDVTLMSVSGVQHSRLNQSYRALARSDESEVLLICRR